MATALQQQPLGNNSSNSMATLFLGIQFVRKQPIESHDTNLYSTHIVLLLRADTEDQFLFCFENCKNCTMALPSFCCVIFSRV